MMKIRMKVWVSPQGKRYLAAAAHFLDDSLEWLSATCLHDPAEVRQVTMHASEWQALPYSWFTETESNVPSPGPRVSTMHYNTAGTMDSLKRMLSSMIDKFGEQHVPGILAAINALPDTTAIRNLPADVASHLLHLVEACRDYGA